MFAARRSFFVALMLVGTMCLNTHRTEAGGPDPHAADVAEIRQAAKDYVSAINRGDVESIAAYWTPEGDLVDATGRMAKGRDLARQAVAPAQGTAVANPLVISVNSIRFVTPDVAIEDGLTDRLADSNAAEGMARFTAVWVRREGKWLLDSVRESATQRNTHRDHMQQFAWMIGEWREDSPEPSVQVSCTWGADRNFMLREIRISHPASPQVTINQRIGWEPEQQQIKSWSFDSEGGHSEGLYSRDGNRWVVATTGVTPDGKRTTSTNECKRIDQDTLLWAATNAVVDGSPLPDHQLRLVRQSGGDKTSGK